MRATEPGQRPAPRRRSTGSSGPRTEAAAGSGYGLRKASRFKGTKPYRGAVRAAYTAQPVKTRRQTVRATQGQRDVASRVVQRTHGERHRQFSKDMSGQIINSRQRKVIAAYQKAHPDRAARELAAGRARYLRYRPRQAAEIPHEYRDIKPSTVGGLLIGPAMVPWRAAKATVEDPRTLPNTAKGLKDILVGTFPAGAKIAAGTGSDMIHHRLTFPTLRHAARDYAVDVAKRYSESDRQMIERFKKKGFAQEAIELSPYGRLIGKGLGKTALGARVVGKARPAVRLSGDHVLHPKTDASVFKAARQHGLDKVRTRVTAKRAAQGGDLLAKEAQDAGQVVGVSKRLSSASRRKMVATGRVRNKLSEMHAIAQDVKHHGKAAVKLSKPERKAFAWAGRGVMHANAKTHRAELLADIKYHEDRIKAGRAHHGDKGSRFRPDNLKDLAYLRAHIDEAFTPRLQQTIRNLHKSDVAHATEDPSLFPMQAAHRRIAQQDQYLRDRGIKVEPAPVKPVAKAPVVPVEPVAVPKPKPAAKAKAVAVVDDQAVRRASERVDTLTADVADAQAQVERIAKNRPEGSPVRVRAEARAERLAADLADAKKALTKTKRGKKAKPAPAAAAEVAAPKAAAEAPLHIPTVKEVKGKAFSLRMKAARELKREGKVSPETAAALEHHQGLVEKMSPNGAKPKAEAKLPDMAYQGPETDIAHLRRVYKEANAAGLERPLYFPSEKFALEKGGGTALQSDAARAMGSSRQYTGKLYATGREVLDPKVYARGRARSIKRKWNWRLVHDQLDTHAFKSIDGMVTKGKTLGELRHAVDNATGDLKHVAFYNPGRFQSAVAELRRQGVDIEHDEGTFGEALKSALKENGELSPNDLGETGWHVVPHDVLDEIRMETGKPSKLGRAWDQTKAFQSRMLLGTNPSWLAFQMLSEGAVTAAAMGGRLSSFAKAPLYFRKLDQKTKDDLVPWLNAGVAHHELVNATLGPASDSLMARGWRAFRESGIGEWMHKGNLVQHMMNADHAKSTYLRKVLLYDTVKREAFHRMGENATAIAQLNDRLSHILTLGPEAKMRELLNNKDNLERYAQHLNDMLGDFTTYTAHERMGLRRYTMFYGFLRYSLRMAFYTMPVKHPLMTAIIANLGRMQTEEVRNLLGGDELPWALGRIYWDDNGQLKSIDLQRANPAMNALTQMRDVTQAPGMLPPVATAAIDQIFHINSYKDRPWAVHGKPKQHNPTSGDFGLGVRGRIAAESLLKTIGAYRIAESASMNGPQGDDSMLFDQRPTKYVQKSIKRSVDESIKQQKAEPHRALTAAVGVLPHNSVDPELAARIRENEARKAKRGKKKPHKPSKGYGIGRRGGKAKQQGYGISGTSGGYQ